MDIRTTFKLVLTVTLMAKFHNVNAIVCYTCADDGSGPCGPNFNPSSPSEDCSKVMGAPGEYYCAGGQFFYKGGTTLIGRGCTANRTLTDRCYEDAKGRYCAYTCNTNLCNNHLNFDSGTYNGSVSSVSVFTTMLLSLSLIFLSTLLI